MKIRKKIYNQYKRIRRTLVKFIFLNANNAVRVYIWRKMGVKVGKRCRIGCMSFSPESYLIELGDDVIIAANVKLITHEGAICIFHSENPHIDLFGKIIIGNNTFIGMNSLILPNTTIGRNCIIGAGSVVRGNVPDNSVAIGNPAQIIMTTEEYRTKVFNSSRLYEYKRLSDKEKKEELLKRVKM